jgi:hypothetical protein
MSRNSGVSSRFLMTVVYGLSYRVSEPLDYTQGAILLQRWRGVTIQLCVVLSMRYTTCHTFII